MIRRNRVDGAIHAHVSLSRLVLHPPLLSAIGGLLLLWVVSPYAMNVLFTDGLLAALIVAALGLAGCAFYPFCRENGRPTAWELANAAGLGIGVGATGVLLLGLAGLLSRGLWFALLAAAAMAGLLRLRERLRALSSTELGTQEERADRPAAASGRSARALSIWADQGLTASSSSLDFVTLRVAAHVLVPAFLAGAVYAASFAPGILWSEEGNGYDILEYHLQVPREYWEAGRITYLSHNIYASFPSLVEMLYLLTFMVKGDPVAAGTLCNFIHLWLGVLAALAGAAFALRWGKAAVLTALLLLIANGWFVYFAGLAYVENGVILFAILALGHIIAHFDDSESRGQAGDPSARSRRPLMAGVFAGFACACKYTGVVMVLVPPAMCLAFGRHPGNRGRSFLSGRIRPMAFYALGSALAFAPWLVKNAAMTGNPVFPLANGIFQASPAGWSPASQEKWNRGHAAAVNEAGVAERLSAFWSRILADPDQRFGPALLLLGFLGLAMRRLRQVDIVLCVMLAVQIGVWLTMTHLYARFATVMLGPLALLGARSFAADVETDRSGKGRRLISGMLFVGLAISALSTGILLRSETGFTQTRVTPQAVVDTFYGPAKAVNEIYRMRMRVLLIGEARGYYFERPIDYATVFNEQPFLTFLESDPSLNDVQAWLIREKISHVLIHWGEIRRLARSYGFSDRVTHDAVAEWVNSGFLNRVIAEMTPNGPIWELFEVSGVVR